MVSVWKHPATFLTYINSAHPIAVIAGRVGENDIRFTALCFKVVLFKGRCVMCLNLTATVAQKLVNIGNPILNICWEQFKE
jgi:hypothetical protein